MDRYLYRAKRFDNGEWVQGVPFEIEAKQVILIKDNENLLRVHYLEENMWTAEIYAIEVDASTICQCTGLKDKNGKLIWENDIASYSDLITRDKKIICIEWNKMKASFVRKYRSPMGSQYLYLDEYIASRMEVIGNIFDNPELLESEE